MSKDFKNVRVKTGKFYISSKEKLDGYKEVTYTDKRTKEERTVYHREFQGITGRLNKIDVYDGNFGKQLRIFLEDDDYLNVIELPLKSPRGSIDNFTASVIRVLGNLKKGDEYRLLINNKSKNSKGRPYKAIIFLIPQEDDGFKAVNWYIDPQEQPKIEVIKDALGDSSYDTTERDNFLKEALLTGLEIFDSTSVESKKEEPVVEAEADDFNDDLPF